MSAQPMIIPPTEEALWRPLYDEVRELPYGTLLTYDEIETIVGRPVQGRNRWVVTRTDKELLRNDSRTLANVRGVGYKVANPEEHLDLMNGRRKRARRQTKRAVNIGRAANLAEIKDPAVRDAIEKQTLHLLNLEARLGRSEERHTRSEKAISAVAVEQAQIESRLARLESLLKESAAPTES